MVHTRVGSWHYLQRLVWHKHSSLLQTLKYYGRKRLYNIRPLHLYYKYFWGKFTILNIKLVWGPNPPAILTEYFQNIFFYKTIIFTLTSISIPHYSFPLLILLISGNGIEQTANTYNLNGCNKAAIKTSKARLKQLKLAWLKHLLIFTLVNRVFIFKMLPKIF